MKTTLLLTTAAVGLFALGSASAAEVLVTSSAGGKGGERVIAFDLANAEGKVTGFNFKLVVPGISEKSANLGSCTKDLPSNWSGGCTALKGGVYVFATSDDLQPLAAGVHSVGSIRISAMSAKGKGKGGDFSIEELFIGDTAGNAMKATARITNDDMEVDRSADK